MDIIVTDKSFTIKRGKQGSKSLEGYNYTTQSNAVRGAISTRKALQKGLVEIWPSRQAIVVVNSKGYPLAEAVYNRPAALKKAFNDLVADLKSTKMIQIVNQN